MSKEYNLEERLALYSEKIIDFCQKNFKNELSKPIINQLLRSATSIGANYSEAIGASSKQDFKNKIHICKKEAIETKYWLRMSNKFFIDQIENLRLLWQEAQELTLIFSKIIGTINKNSSNKNLIKINN